MNLLWIFLIVVDSFVPDSVLYAQLKAIKSAKREMHLRRRNPDSPTTARNTGFHNMFKDTFFKFKNGTNSF